MKRFISFFLLFATTLVADQTFDQESGVLEEVYYGVPFSVTITEQNTPTDFYVSIGTGSTWTPVSSTFGWGDFNPPSELSITLDELYTNVNLGIHTGVRNSGTFTTNPTDLSDQSFSVKTGSATLTGPEEVWFDDVFYYSWVIEESTLPDQVVFEYNDGSGWIGLDTLSIKDVNGFSVHNEFSITDFSVRFTYLGSAYGYTISEWSSTFKPYSFEITNREEIETKLWDDEESVTIKYDKERLSEYTYVIAKVDDVVIDSIGFFQTETIIRTPRKKDAITIVEFYTEWGELITDIAIESNHKYFEISPLTDEDYTTISTIPFIWSYSSHFDLVEVFVKRNSNTFTQIVNSDWELDRSYNYAVKESDTILSFYFIVNDGHTIIRQTIEGIIIGDHCRESELELEIISLRRELGSLRQTISSLNSVIDSLQIFISEIEPDYVFVTLIKDVPNRVETEIETLYSETKTLEIVDGQANLELSDLEYVYIVDVTGNTYDAVWGGSTLYVNNLSPSAYFVVAIDKSGNVFTFKFIL